MTFTNCFISGIRIQNHHHGLTLFKELKMVTSLVRAPILTARNGKVLKCFHTKYLGNIHKKHNMDMISFKIFTGPKFFFITILRETQPASV